MYDILEESVVYQDIFRKGLLDARASAIEAGKRKFVQRLLKKLFGKLPTSMRQKVDKLSGEQIEALAMALLDFKTIDDLKAWLAQYAPSRRSRA